MKILRERLEEGAARARGAVVVIDVIRAFTTAACALAAGAREVRLHATVADALRRKELEPRAFLMGEEGGAPPAGFDHGNSPALLPVEELRDRVIIQRTGMGTRCAVAARRAKRLLGASLVVASATVEALRREELVTLVESGGAPEGDDAVADFLEALLRGERPSVEAVKRRVRACDAAREILEGARAHSPASDIEVCLDVDRFGFAIEIERRGDEVVACSSANRI